MNGNALLSLLQNMTEHEREAFQAMVVVTKDDIVETIESQLPGDTLNKINIEEIAEVAEKICKDFVFSNYYQYMQERLDSTIAKNIDNFISKKLKQ